jgi:SAM-dependent methyltransferase
MKEFWQQQAIKYGSDVQAVNFDLLEDKLEFQQLEKLIVSHSIIGDLGCGNGRASLYLAQQFPEKKFIGVDFIPEMIEASNREKRNLKFFTGSLADKNINDNFHFQFDFIFTKRLLINLKGEQKIIGIENIFSMLKNKGVYALIECFEEPLVKINAIREHIGLAKIEVKFFNEYLKEEFVDFVKTYANLIDVIDFESFYYFISRVFNAKLSEGSAPDYFAPINLLAVNLIKAGIAPDIKGYSPEKIYVFQKR